MRNGREAKWRNEARAVKRGNAFAAFSRLFARDLLQ
jgi:hypothetical protein